MKRLQLTVIALALVSLALAAGTGCLPLDDIEDPSLHGLFYSASAVEDCPEGCIPYVTAQGDILYIVAARAYGKGYKLGLIRTQNADDLPDMTNENGTLEGGKILFIPRDYDGRMVDPRVANARSF